MSADLSPVDLVHGSPGVRKAGPRDLLTVGGMISIASTVIGQLTEVGSYIPGLEEECYSYQWRLVVLKVSEEGLSAWLPLACLQC